MSLFSVAIILEETTYKMTIITIKLLYRVEILKRKVRISYFSDFGDTGVHVVFRWLEDSSLEGHKTAVPARRCMVFVAPIKVIL